MDILEGFMLSEISKTDKTNTAHYHLHVKYEKAELVETESRMAYTRYWGWGKWKILVK